MTAPKKPRPGGDARTVPASQHHEDTERRIRVVLAHIVRFGWLPTSGDELAESLDVGLESIRRYRLTAEARIRAHAAKEPIPSREEFLRRLHTLQRRCGELEDTKSEVSLLALEARVSGWEQAPVLQAGSQVVIATLPLAPASDDADSDDPPG